MEPFCYHDDRIDLMVIAVDAGDEAAVAAASEWANRVAHYGVADAAELAAVGPRWPSQNTTQMMTWTSQLLLDWFFGG